MNFLRVNVNHDVIITVTANFVIVGVRNNMNLQSRRFKVNIKRVRTKCCCISKISKNIERTDNCPGLILQIVIDIFDTQ